MRHVKLGVTAGKLDGGLQNDDGDGSIHVVVAVDQDLLAAGDGGLDARYSIVHSGHQERVVQMIERGAQEALSGAGLRDSPVDQDTGCQGPDLQGRAQLTNLVRVGLGQ